MTRLPIAFALVLLAACSGPKTAPENEAPAVEEAAVAADRETLEALRAKFARIEMTPDVSFLTSEEREVVNLLNQVGERMDAIYLRQRQEGNPQIREEIAASSHPDRELVLDLFDLHFGVFDAEEHAFWGDKTKPAGAGFYPEDMTKEEFEAWIAAHPQDKAAFESPYTVIRRKDGGLVAIPYSEYYRDQLEPAAELMREAAAKTGNASLKKFLTMRAESFLSDDYFESEMAWMDLDGPIEAAIGPYETYTDGLMGLKTAFEAFITIKNPQKSGALAKYKDFLRDMEANLPVEDRYKNFRRGFESPIAVVDQVHGGGDNVPGIQTIAFNLPNDERVREAKGAKKVLLDNVMGAKFAMILRPMAEKVLVPEQASMVMKEHMAGQTLFHELSHSLGPGVIVKNGVETTVTAELKELYSPLEEGKADVMGAYNVLYMMERGELPAAEKENFLATYFVGLFRAMRFGMAEAHGKGAAFQYAYFRRIGAAGWDEAQGRFRLDFAKLEQGISDLTRDVVVLQGNGEYAAVKAFLETTAVQDGDARSIVATMGDLPVDIQPVYPSRI